ncbi:unnamed protein product, partial [Brassica oleracea var. botrytis]
FLCLFLSPSLSVSQASSLSSSLFLSLPLSLTLLRSLSLPETKNNEIQTPSSSPPQFLISQILSL